MECQNEVGIFMQNEGLFLWTVQKLELVIYNRQWEMLSRFSVENIVVSVVDLGIRARITETMCR